MRGFSLALAALVSALFLGCASTSPEPPRSPLSDGRASETGQLREVLVAIENLPPVLRDRAAYGLARDYGLRAKGGWPLQSLNLQCRAFELSPGASLEEVLARLEKDHRVEMVAPISLFKTLLPEATAAEPIASSSAAQSYEALQHGAGTMRLGQAHRYATGDGVVVAVIDTGVDINHPELARKVRQIRNFVRWDQFAGDLHGTAIAGVLAAESDDGQGVTGVAPDVSLLALKACWHEKAGSIEAHCTSYTLAQAIDAALEGGADVMNLSLTGPSDPILERLVDYALNQGVAIVAASGDEGAGFPASHEGVIAVRTANREGHLNHGRQLDARETMAPGVEVLTTVPGGRYDFLSGSSLAAAHISGLVALLLQTEPSLKPATLVDLVQPMGRTAMVDACTALERLAGKRLCSP